MQQQITTLVKLQNIDLKIGEIEEAKDRYPKRIESLKEKLEEEQRVADSERQKLEDLNGERKKNEQALELDVQKIQKSEEKLLSVKTNKEYQAALKEIALAKEANLEREDEILRGLEEIDALKKEVKKRARDLEAITEEFEKEKSELTKKLKEFEKQLSKKMVLREELFLQIDKELLRQYENIRKHRHGIAVVPTKDGFCQGCYMGIPPQSYNEVQKGMALICCQNCNRILYWPNDLDSSPSEGQSK